jgi:hypothetical protein
MTRRDNDFYDQYRRLQRVGWDVDKENNVAFNSGSESLTHRVAKTIVAHVGLDMGYCVDSEVTHGEHGEIDVLLWNHPERLTYAVEIEHNPTPEVKQDKLSRYVTSNSEIDDMILLNANDIPADRFAALEHVEGVMFG